MSADGELTGRNGCGSRRGKIISTAAASREEAAMRNEQKNSKNVTLQQTREDTTSEAGPQPKGGRAAAEALLRLDNVARRLAITLLAQQQPKRTSASHPRNATRCSKRIRPAHPESSSGQRTGVQLRAPEGARERSECATDKPVCCNALLGGLPSGYKAHSARKSGRAMF
jgi:hypothetical protein